MVRHLRIYVNYNATVLACAFWHENDGDVDQFGPHGPPNVEMVHLWTTFWSTKDHIDANLINYARLMTKCQNTSNWSEIWHGDVVGCVHDEYKRKL